MPHPEIPCHLPPHTIPPGYPSAPAPSILYHALNLDWQFVDLCYYTCVSAILPNHATLTVSQSPKDCFIHLCLFLHSRIHGYHLSKFHIYVLVYSIGVFLSGYLHSVE